MIKTINQWPEGNKFLHVPAEEVEVEQENNTTHLYPWPKKVTEHVQDLIDTAESIKEKTLGLSSCQIWDDEDNPPLAIFIVKVKDEENSGQFKWLEFINPTIETSGGQVKVTEACLSVSNYKKLIKRKKNVTITFQTLKSSEKTTLKIMGKLSDLPIVLQHEYDHLLGKLIKR